MSKEQWPNYYAPESGLTEKEEKKIDRACKKLSEAHIQKQILDYLNGLSNCKAIKIMAANEAGTPDIFCCYRGVTIVLELKASEKEARESQHKQKRQHLQLKQWGETGAFVNKIWNLDMVKKIIGDIGTKI